MLLRGHRLIPGCYCLLRLIHLGLSSRENLIWFEHVPTKGVVDSRIRQDLQALEVLLLDRRLLLSMLLEHVAAVTERRPILLEIDGLVHLVSISLNSEVLSNGIIVFLTQSLIQFDVEVVQVFDQRQFIWVEDL